MPRVLHPSTGEDVAGRRCPQCGLVYPASSEFFYQRGDGRLEYCLDNASGCHARYWRNMSERRRADARMRSRRGTLARAREQARAQRPRAQARRVVYPSFGRTAPERTPPHARPFGVEIEAASPDPVPAVQTVITGLRAFDLRVGSWNDTSAWHVGTEHCGLEMRSPVLIGFGQVERACQVIRDTGLGVTVDCGLHVHLDARDLSASRMKRLVTDWFRWDPLIRQLVSRSRRTAMWCIPFADNVIERVGTVEESDNLVLRDGQFMRALANNTTRYHAMNLCSYPRHGTIEFRLHQGTHNANKIRQWVEFLRGFWEASLSGGLQEPISDVEELIDIIHEHYSVIDRDFLKERVAHFASQTV